VQIRNDQLKGPCLVFLYRSNVCVSCGCTGPGYIPNTKDRLLAYFEEVRREYQLHLDFWRKREEPTDQPGIDRDKTKNWRFIGRVPNEIRSRKSAISNEEAKGYWIGRLQEINQKINLLK
jgi:hypothetical protein